MEATFEVLSPGLLTTVQDAGRPGFGHLGVPQGGAADPWSLAVANLLIGNGAGSAVLECTVVGPDLRVIRETIVGLTGPDLGAFVRPSGRRLRPNAAHALAAGEVLSMPGGQVGRGLRAYLAVPGGLDVPSVLSSRSTCLAGAFGGLDGRPLRTGDRLAQLADVTPEVASGWVGRTWPASPADPMPGVVVRLLPGPEINEGPEQVEAACRALSAGAWMADPASDRQAIRLVGSWRDAMPMLAGAGEWLSHGVVPGAIQLPPDGRPIVLLADAQPTGGYPVVALAIAADVPILGQLAPGDPIRFEPVTADAARAAWAERQAALASGKRRLREAVGWDDLWQSAGS